MSDANSTAPRTDGKPAKPRPDFPLFPHATKRWAKKINGRMVYFGPWDDPAGAEAKYNREAKDLHAGKKPREASQGGTTLGYVVSVFLAHKEQRRDNGELAPRTWKEYESTCETILRTFGKHRLAADLDPDDFGKLRDRLASTLGAVALGNAIQRIRCVFKYALAKELLDRPARYGPDFSRPSAKTLRLERAAKGSRMFEAAEIRTLMDAANPALRAMILLGVNAGMGNSDCGRLPLSALDLAGGWLDYPRPKTGVPRRVPLWKETVKAIRDALAVRPDPKDADHAGLLFITKYGLPWFKESEDNPVSKEMAKLMKALSINGHRGFYSLRRSFETIGGEAKDQVAVNAIMGHVDDTMAGVYRQRISDERLRAVVDHVHGWLFAPAKKKSRKV